MYRIASQSPVHIGQIPSQANVASQSPAKYVTLYSIVMCMDTKWTATVLTDSDYVLHGELYMIIVVLSMKIM